MKAFLGFCITVVFIYLFSSCQKHDIARQADSDSTTLKTCATLIPNQLPLDTFNKYNYYFDASKRLIRIELFAFMTR